MQYMWIFKGDSHNDDISSCNSNVLISEILNKTDIKYIFKDIKSLIEFLLLSMHCENELYENTVDNNAISYKINDLRKKSSEINNSFIKKIFFLRLHLNIIVVKTVALQIVYYILVAMIINPNLYKIKI